MGNCQSTNKHSTPTLQDVTSSPTCAENDSITPKNFGPRPEKRNPHVIHSLVRVGSRIIAANSNRAEKSGGTLGGNPPPLKELQASTYDHVHEMVNMNIESYHTSNSNGQVSSNSGDSSKSFGKVGLINMGNTCFMNSSLQCLSNTIPLTDYFLGYDYKKEINLDNFLGTNGALVTSYAELIKHLWLGPDSSYRPEDFKFKLEQFAPQFQGYEQHDSQELLAFLLDGIHEDLNRVKKRSYIEEKDCDGTNDHGDSIMAWETYLLRNRSIVVDMFQGQLRNTLTCKNKNKLHPDGKTYGCGRQNVRFDPFMYLTLPISSTCNTLDDCLQLYCEEEFLEGNEKWYCPQCRTCVEASKKIDLWMLPPILIIHLKRFKFSDFGKRSKIDQPIRYPLNDWNLSSFKKSIGGSYPCYDLYALCHHRGNVGFGHYTAHAKNRFDGKWYEFNDSQCNEIGITESSACNDSSAYCLFYNRVERVSHSKGEISKLNTKIRRQSINRPELWPHLQRSKVNEWTSIRDEDYACDLIEES